MSRQFSHILIGAIYHTPDASDFITTNHITTSIDNILREHPYSGVMVLGDFNRLNDTQLKNSS